MRIETEKDLQELIDNKIGESTTLEYKSLESLNNNSEIAKDVSAMANSEGGIIIYGIKEDEAGFPNEIEWTSNKGLKDKIDQVLTTQINRKIESCKIEEVKSEGNNKEFVIVVNVPRSDLAPHQASKSQEVKKYYRRSNSRVREMEQGEIEDLFFKRKRPKLEIELKRCPTRKPSYDIMIHNKGKVLAEKIFIKLLIPGVLQISDQNWPKIKDFYNQRGALCSEYQYIGEDFIYPDLPNLFGKIFHPEEHFVESIKIGFLIVCKDMPISRGVILLGDTKSTEVRLSEDEGTPLPDWELKDSFYILSGFYQ